MKFPSIALLGIASTQYVVPSSASATAALESDEQSSGLGLGLSLGDSATSRGNLRSLQASARWPQCGTAGDCRAECSDRCDFSVQFNMECCNSECPTAAGCPGASTGSGVCNNTIAGMAERRCGTDGDCTIKTCSNAAAKTGQLCSQTFHCVSLSRDAGSGGWFDWTSPTCDVDVTRPGTCLFTEKPSVMPSVRPSGAPSATPSATPTASPSAAPTVKASAVPSATPSATPSASPSVTVTDNDPSPCPTDSEGPDCTIPAQDYGYAFGGDNCNVRVINENNEEDIIEHEDNVVIKFWAFGDFPYDEEASTGNQRACCQESGGLVGCLPNQDMCIAADCGTTPDQSNNACDFEGTRFDCAPGCVYEGREYNCWRNTIVPWMNVRDDDVSFAFFTGDFIKGRGSGNSGFCNPDSFDSRRALFDTMDRDVIFSVGDNDWNECNGFGNDNNNNVIRKLYRSSFTTLTSFNRDFPSQAQPGYPAKPPTINRNMAYPELFNYVWNDVVFIGVSRPAGWSPPGNINNEWIKSSLEDISTNYDNFADQAQVCDAIKSVVILSHTSYFSNARTVIDAFFDSCGRGNDAVPLLNTRGNTHVYSYCRKETNTFELVNGGDFSPDPETSDPHLVTIIRDPRTGDHYFKVDRNNEASNGCSGFGSF